MLAAGVDPAFNTPAGLGDQRNYELLIEAGFTAPEAIQVMTWNGARVLGIGDRLGTIASGKGADLVVIRGDREHWIPFVKDRIVKVDLDARRIVLDWGLDWLD